MANAQQSLAKLVEEMERQTMKLKLQAYKAKDGWRWRAKNKGRIIAEGGEAYERRATMVKTLMNVFGFGAGYSEDKIKQLTEVDEVSI